MTIQQLIAHALFSAFEIGFVAIGLQIVISSSRMIGECAFRATYEIESEIYYADVRLHKRFRIGGLIVAGIGFAGSIAHNFI